MKVVEKVNFVEMHKCDDGLKMIFSNGVERTAVTMDWVEVAKAILDMNEHEMEAYTMMQIGLDPFCESHRDSFNLSWFQVRG
jgi:hypothetical protein